MINLKYSVALSIGLCVFQTSKTQAQTQAQNIRTDLKKGNEQYKEKKYQEAATTYAGALQKDPTSYTGMFNLGDAMYKDKKYDQARQSLDAGAKASTNKMEQSRAYHNIGNTYLEQKKWEEAINAYKQALRLNPSDTDTKYNLAYAQAMLKNNGGGKDNKKDKDQKNDKNKDKKDQDKKDQDKKDQDKKDQDKKDQDKKDQNKKDQDKKDGDPKDKGDKDKQNQQQGPQGQPSKLTQQQAENLLNALRQEEKKLRDKKGNDKGTPVKLDKDW